MARASRAGVSLQRSRPFRDECYIGQRQRNLSYGMLQRSRPFRDECYAV